MAGSVRESAQAGNCSYKKWGFPNGKGPSGRRTIGGEYKGMY